MVLLRFLFLQNCVSQPQQHSQVLRGPDCKVGRGLQGVEATEGGSCAERRKEGVECRLGSVA